MGKPIRIGGATLAGIISLLSGDADQTEARNSTPQKNKPKVVNVVKTFPQNYQPPTIYVPQPIAFLPQESSSEPEIHKSLSGLPTRMSLDDRTRGSGKRKQEEIPAAEPVNPGRMLPRRGQSDVYMKGIVGADAYGSSDSWKTTGKARAIADLGDVNLWAQGTVFYLNEDVDKGITIDGHGVRGQAGADVYFDAFRGGRFLGRIAIGRESRGYTAKDKFGNKLDFGNDSNIYSGEVALGEADLESEDYFGVTKNFNFIRGRVAQRKGDVTGDIDGNHKALNADAEAHLRIAGPVSAHGGVSYFGEKYGDALKQRIVAAELGAGYHTDYGYLRASAIGQLLKNKDEKGIGGMLKGGWRIYSTDNVAVDFEAMAGVMHNIDLTETDYFGGIGVNAYATGRARK